MTLNQATHRTIFIKILSDIFKDPTVGPVLGFKGGTAAYLFYDLNRFSVDLDFDLLDIEKKDYVFERVKNILETYGTLRNADVKSYTLFYLLSYHDKEKNHQNIKVEISHRECESRYEVKSYMGISMKVMVKDDMVANKLLAMKNRMGRANRDIFDVYFFLKNDWPINKVLVEKRSGLAYIKFIEECIESLEKRGSNDILSRMGELLTQSQKEWVRSKLVPETIFLLKLTLDNER
ncbi:MAG: nucleotidyl transferase AbiEii/AbiGii toxin family protein [Patescibacteria group bacterium]